MLSQHSPITFNDKLPSEVDVAVIGAGIIGISTAWFLAQSGLRVVVCEKGRVAGEQSSRNWGWVRQQGRDEAELPIMMESNRIWQGLGERVGEDLGFRQQGVMYIANDQKEVAEFEHWVELARRHDLLSKLLSPQQIQQRIPSLRGEWCGGVITESDGRAEPFVAVPALARGCQRLGVAVIENCAVRDVSFSAGQVSGVVTEHSHIRCQAVVCAGGAWSALLMGKLGYRFPQLTVRSTVARTAPMEEIFPGNVACGNLAIRRRIDGGYSIAPCFSEHLLNRDSFRYSVNFAPTLLDAWGHIRLRLGRDSPGGLWPVRQWQGDSISPFEQTRVLNPRPNAKTLAALRERFNMRLPAYKNVAFEQSWAGMIDATPDVVPVMDQVPNKPGLFLASGFSGHGFGIGPAAGRVMSDLVQGNDIGHDLSRFRASRFSDGSKLKRGPSL